MRVNGWTLYEHPLFRHQIEKLVARVELLQRRDPIGYRDQPVTKLLATINRYTREIIPRDPNAPEFRQGNTLGADNRHWFRAKFHERYRLFYRFSSKDKIMIFAWVNDDATLRKAGAKTDPYAVFHAMLEAGNPPSSIAELLAQSTAVGETVGPKPRVTPGRRSR
jgi:toxin YhaV